MKKNSMIKILDVLTKVDQKKVLIVGDILLDEYSFGKAEKVSTGIKIPIIVKERTEYRLGGAANIASNVAGLSCDTALLGTCGIDDAGKMVRKICAERNIKIYGATSANTTVKQRIYVDNQQTTRLDSEFFDKSVNESVQSTLREFRPDLIILADYLYGAISQSVIDNMTEYAKENNINIFFTSRNFNQFTLDKRVITVSNLFEWESCDSIRNQEQAFITMGENGVKYISENKNVENRLYKRYPINVSGAGDTTLAVLAVMYKEDIDIEQLLLLANLMGGIAVEEELTYVLSSYDLITAVFDYLSAENNLNKILDENLSSAVIQAWRKKGYKIVFTNGCYDLLHLGHIKSFQFAREFGEKLVVAVNSDDSVRRLKGQGRPINNLQDRTSALAYLSMVDLVLPFEGDTAIAQVKLVCPDVYVKGEEYKTKELPEAEYASRVEYVPMIQGTSTTAIINKISSIGDKHE